MAAPKGRVKLTGQIGSSGLKKVGGYVAADFLPKLQGLQGYKVYTEMKDNDPLISGIVFAINMLMRGLEWSLQWPDGADDKMKETFERALFEDLSPSFSDVMGEISTMFPYGYAPLEVTWSKTENGMLVPSVIGLRSQETIQRWEFDENGNILGLWQQDFEHPIVFIPIEKMLLFRTESTMNNPEGRSILRSSYVYWVRKKAIEEAEGRAALRTAGLVVVRIPAEIINNNNEIYTAFKTMADNLASDRQGSIIIPSDVDEKTGKELYSVTYTVADGRRSIDFSPIISRVDSRIASSVLADWILLGQQAIGSWALSSDKTAMFTQSLWAWTKSIADVFNRQLIKRMWDYNGLDQATMPKLVPGDIGSPNLVELITYLTGLTKIGMPLFPDENLENYLRQQGGLPEITAEQRKAMDQARLEQAQQLMEIKASIGGMAAPKPMSGAQNQLVDTAINTGSLAPTPGVTES